MTVSRIRTVLFCLLVAALVVPAIASARDASFLPESENPAEAAAPAPAPDQPAPQLAPQAATPEPVVIAPAAPTVAATAALEPAIESGSLGDIDADSVGTMNFNEGGLGAGMWKGTSRILVERLLPTLPLPSQSATLNGLAQRLLLSVAGAPEGTAGSGQSLIAVRVQKLIELGDAAGAWKLAMLAKPGQLDEITLRLAAEAALVSNAREDVCNRLPDIMKEHTGAEWQKSMLVCQLRAKDTKAAQLTLDLLHTQGVRDDTFFGLAEKNVMAGGKQLPRQLTPLKPLMLALLRLTDLQVREEVYAHPDAALISELLHATPAKEPARLALAERAASRGIISTSDLADTYHAQSFMPYDIANAANSRESGGRLRALLYQAAQGEKEPVNRIAYAVKFLQSVDAEDIDGPMAQILLSIIGDTAPDAKYALSAATIARVYIVAGKPELALGWFKLARETVERKPETAPDLHTLWPVAVFAGLESDKDFAKDVAAWVDEALKTTDPAADISGKRASAASILLLLDAVGYAVPESLWARVADSRGFEKLMMPPAFILERLRVSGTANRRGEAVLEGIIAAGGSAEPSLIATIETTRALRLTGLTADASSLAHEAADRAMGQSSDKAR